MPSSLNRRTFLLAAGNGAAAATMTGAYAANDTIHIGCIGTGGRARHLMKVLGQMPSVKIVTVCDVWDHALAEGKKLGDAKAATTKQFADVLNSKDVHAVLIGTPDHWHVPITIAACEAGKDVYVEKPLTHNLGEGKAVIAAQDKHQRIVQVGTQQRSMPHIEKAREIVRSGRIGKVHKVKMSWNRNADRVQKVPLNINPSSVDWKTFLGNARQQDFDEYRFRHWRWFWDFGGGLFSDLMVHWIDVAHWVVGVDRPLKAVSIGEHVAARDIWETPDTVQTLLTYPGDVQMHFEGTFSNARHGSRIEFLGTDGTVYVDRGRYEVIPERNRKIEPEQHIVGNGPLGADFYDKPDGELVHLTNWIESIRSRKKPSAPAEAGVAAAAAAHLANQALRTGQTAVWKEA